MAYPTYNTSNTSLAGNYGVDYGFGGGTGSEQNYFDLGSATSGEGLGSAGAGSLASKGAGIMGMVGQGLNLVGSGVSLVGMLQNMKDARKNNKLNRRNITQQMNQSETAFNRAVARQDGTSEAIRERNERVAQMNQ